ncbi:flagellar brake protein [Piscinibacter sp.]|uniref:flagellar brake protein n=1 Tax=Piscinibacter sp. TaxID=1903157 RepID=UPI0039E71F2A
METLPMPLESLSAANGGLDEFRISAPREIVALLKQFQDGSLLLHLNGSNGAMLSTTLWSLDPARGQLSFSADAGAPATQSLVECDEAVAVGYLDSIKVQFDVRGLVLVRGAAGSAIGARMPQELFRFQRRSAFRVRPLPSSSPVARVRHPAIAEMQLALRVIDVSIGGCALFLPDDVPPIQPGSVMNQVQLDLDADTRVLVDLRLQHATVLGAQARGARMGCEFVRLNSEGERALQRFIDQTQKRRRLLSLD